MKKAAFATALVAAAGIGYVLISRGTREDLLITAVLISAIVGVVLWKSK